jgi:hypothetical protein
MTTTMIAAEVIGRANACVENLRRALSGEPVVPPEPSGVGATSENEIVRKALAAAGHAEDIVSKMSADVAAFEAKFKSDLAAFEATMKREIVAEAATWR